MNIQDELQVNVSEAVSVGASFSLPVAEDQDVGVNGRLEYQLLPVDGGVFRLVHSVSIADGSTDVKLVLYSPLDREQVRPPIEFFGETFKQSSG